MFASIYAVFVTPYHGHPRFKIIADQFSSTNNKMCGVQNGIIYIAFYFILRGYERPEAPSEILHILSEYIYFITITFEQDVKIFLFFRMKLPKNSMMIAKTCVKPKNAHTSTSGEDIFDSVSILFEYMRNGNRKKLIQLIRPLDGKFCDTLRKLKSKLVEDSLRIMSLTGSQDVNVAVCDASSSEISEQTNEEILFNPNIITIEVAGKNYRLIRNAPECSAIKLALSPLVGCPLLASFDLSPERILPVVENFQ
ncbi:unnamed protein product [Enterobius vermicularis]|uniref:PAP-associated domain-containing protein n=1 Tax=Enterobius vermicularis TaxID=51028 RepID=A0A0N4UY81_ENTVE|nr:unnamed protein product [Enterobius vermicularis]